MWTMHVSVQHRYGNSPLLVQQGIPQASRERADDATLRTYLNAEIRFGSRTSCRRSLPD